MSLLSGLKRISPKSAIITSSGDEKNVSSQLVDILKEKLGTGNVETTPKQKPPFNSVCVTMPHFSVRVNESYTLRQVIYDSDIDITVIKSKKRLFGGAKIQRASPVSGKVFVKQSISVGTSDLVENQSRNWSEFLDAFKEKLEDWGQIKMPFALLLLIGGMTLFIGYKIKQGIAPAIQDYSDSTKRAIESKEGLQKLIDKRSGKEKSTATQPTK